MVLERSCFQKHFSVIGLATVLRWKYLVSRTEQVQVLDNFGRRDAQTLSQKMHLNNTVSKFMEYNDSKRYTPSTPWNRLLGGTYISLQFGQNSFTVSSPGKSERPHGTTGLPPQYTRGHAPNTVVSYLSTWRCKLNFCFHNMQLKI